MSFATQFHVPGAFNFDTGPGPSQPLHANIFRPPPSPSASTYNLAKSTGSLLSDISMSNAPPAGATKRKRTSARETTSCDWNPNADGADDGRDASKGREIRYTLAGQISTTPAGATAGADNDLLEDSVYSDVNYRRALGPQTAFDADSPTIQAAERMGDNAPSLAGWSLFSLQTIGDMVGKVWEFCRTRAAFRGFHAGGGVGYNVNGSTVTETTGRPWGVEPDTPVQTADAPPINREGPAYAAQQPPYSPECHDLNTPDSTPQPAAKRRQVSANNDELRNWVVVDEPSDQKPRRFAAEVKSAAARTSGLVPPRSGYYSQTSLSSHRRINTPSSRFTGATTTRPSLRISHAGSPNLTAHEPASFASPRSSPVSRPTSSRIPVPTRQPSHSPLTIPGTTSTSTFPSRIAAPRPPSRQSPAAAAASSLHGSRSPLSPTKTSYHHHRSHSTASAASSSSATAATTTATTTTTQHHRLLLRRHQHDRSPVSTDDMLPASSSPRLDAEARQLAQRRLAAERDADARVDAFNARLLSMIRQGREALGTRVEVEMVGGGQADESGGGAGGWEDDD